MANTQTEWLDAVRIGVGHDVERWGVPRAEADAFLAQLSASGTLADLANAGVDGLVRALLAASALRDAVLDPVGRTVDALGAQRSSDAANAFANRLRDAGLDADLVEEAVRRLQHNQRQAPSPGRKKTKRADAIHLLEYALEHDAGLSARARHRVVAAIVSDFYEPIDAEGVRQIMKDVRRRRGGRTVRGRPIVAFHSCTEDALRALGVAKPRTPEERGRTPHASGARGYLVVEGRE